MTLKPDKLTNILRTGALNTKDLTLDTRHWTLDTRHWTLDTQQ